MTQNSIPGTRSTSPAARKITERTVLPLLAICSASFLRRGVLCLQLHIMALQKVSADPSAAVILVKPDTEFFRVRLCQEGIPAAAGALAHQRVFIQDRVCSQHLSVGFKILGRQRIPVSRFRLN